MGTRQIRIIIGIYCSHPARICGFIYYDVLNMTVFVVLRSYVLNLNVLYNCLLVCVSDILNVGLASCVSVSWLRTSYMCVDPFPVGSFMFVSLHTEVHFNTIWVHCVREWNNRKYALRGHMTSFLWKWKLYDFFFIKRLVGHIFNKIIVIWFFKSAPFS